MTEASWSPITCRSDYRFLSHLLQEEPSLMIAEQLTDLSKTEYHRNRCTAAVLDVDSRTELLFFNQLPRPI